MAEVPNELRIACRKLIGDADVQTRTTAVDLFRLTAEQNKSVAECLEMLADPADEKKTLAAEVLAKIGGVDELPVIVAQLDRNVPPAVPTAAAAIIQSIRANKRLPDDPTRERLRTWTTHESETLRVAAVGYHTRTDVALTVPAEEWVRWSEDRSAKVRVATATGLQRHAATSEAAKMRLVALEQDPDEEVARVASWAALSRGELKDTAISSYLSADTMVVAHLQLKTILDLPFIKKHLLADLREAIKDSPVLSGFKFDPLQDLDGAYVVFDSSGTFAVLNGQFNTEEKLKIKGVKGFDGRAAICLSDEVILTGPSADTIEKLIKRKPADGEEMKAIRAAVPSGVDPYFGWVAITGCDESRRYLEQGLPQLGVALTEAQAKAFMGLRLGVRMKEGNWAIELQIFVDGDADMVATWQSTLESSIDFVKKILPFARSLDERLNAVFDDLDDALKKVVVKKDQIGVTATLVVKQETMEEVAKVIGGWIKPE